MLLKVGISNSFCGRMFSLVHYFQLPHEKFLQFDWLGAVVFQLNLKYLHVKISRLFTVPYFFVRSSRYSKCTEGAGASRIIAVGGGGREK